LEYIAWFKELNKESIPLVGGKGANLGEMYNIPLPIPPGFCVTSYAYKSFLDETGLRNEINEILNGLELGDTEKIHAASKQISDLILGREVPSEIRNEIIESYEMLDISKEVVEATKGTPLDAITSASKNPPFVAIRSSATAEDLPEASFAGQQETAQRRASDFRSGRQPLAA